MKDLAIVQFARWNSSYYYDHHYYYYYYYYYYHYLIASRIPAGPRILGFSIPCFPPPLFSSICAANLGKININTFPHGTWWFHGAICLAMRAPRELFGAVEGSLGARMGVQGC